MEREKVDIKKSSNHNIRLVFNEKWKPHSETPKRLRIYHKFGSSKKTIEKTPIEIPMKVWDKKKQEIKEEYQKEFEVYQQWIDAYKQTRKECLILLHNNHIDVNGALKKILNKVEDGDILDKFEDFCHIKKRNRKGQVITKDAIKKHIRQIKSVQKCLFEQDAPEYQRLKWSHIRSASYHIEKIETLLGKHNGTNNQTKNRYLESLNYASYVNPNITLNKPFANKFENIGSGDEEKKYLERNDLSSGIPKIGNNPQWLEAYLFWLLSFCLRGLDGVDIAMMNKEWLCDEKGRKVNYKDVKSYLPNYRTLINKGKGIKLDKNTPKKIKDIIESKEKFSNKKVYIRGYRKKTSAKKIGIKILLNHYPTLIIIRLLKICVGINRPHFLYRGDDPLKIYNFDMAFTSDSDHWKNLLNTYTKQCQKMFGENGNIKNCRNTFTQELSVIYGGNADGLLSTSLGHRKKKEMADYYFKTEQYKLDILQLEVIKSYNINKLLELIIKWCSKQTHTFSGSEIPLIKTDGITQWINKEEIEALKIPLSYWSWHRENEYQRLMKKENDVVAEDFDEDGNPIYGKIEYSDSLKELIKERQKSISEKKIKRPHLNYNRDTGQTEESFK